MKIKESNRRMRNINTKIVSWWEELVTAHYYDPTTKTEGDGPVPEGAVVIDNLKSERHIVRYKIDKSVIKEYGTLIDDEIEFDE